MLIDCFKDSGYFVAMCGVSALKLKYELHLQIAICFRMVRMIVV